MLTSSKIKAAHHGNGYGSGDREGDGSGNGFGEGCQRLHDEELLAAPSAQRILLVRVGAQRLRNCPENGVTGCVSISVVDRFEVIDIQHHD